MGMKGGGEIVQVQGGHVFRSSGRKDRHSKVFTSKGLRDRRVRLSAHTAIRFYDVQDRLGYDRPSKAVDWLIKKAKLAIDKLAELPPYYPMANDSDPNVKINEPAIATESPEYNFQLHRQLRDSAENDSATLTPPLETFFPASSASTSVNYQVYPVDFISRLTNPSQNLGLSLHNFHSPVNDRRLITDSTPAGYGAYQRMAGVEWNGDGETEHSGLWQPLLGQSSAEFSQREPLQSSLAHSLPIRNWNHSPVDFTKNRKTHSNQQSSLLGAGYDGSSDFRMASRNQGEDEDVHGFVSKRQSSSPNSRH